MQKTIHLFNCDQLYELRVIENLLNSSKPMLHDKLGFDFTVKHHYFSLTEMDELSEKVIPALKMDFAVFVVHAHESRLSINGGRGYTKVYRALMKATGGNVIIVIGGDDNYKSKEQEEQLVISPWARRIVCVQFSEEYIDGRKSFIFSWGEKHRPIHVEALMHFFDPDKNGEKFKYQLPKQADSTSKPARVKPAEPISTKVEERKCSSYVGKTAQEMVDREESAANQIRPTIQWARPKEKNSVTSEPRPNVTKDLSILGWDASPEAMSAVVNLINSHRDALSLSTDTDCFNGLGVNDLISYFEHNPLKYCFLVADADKIKAVLEQERGINMRLLQTADRNVAKGIIITICCPWFQSQQEKSLVRSAIKKAFSDNRKVYITWFENGNVVGNPDDLIHFLMSYPFPQQLSAVADCPPRGMTGKQCLPYPWNYKIHLPSGKTVLVLTRMRYGIISDQTNQPDDVLYWKPGFVVPPEIKASLYKKNAKTANRELFILMTEDGTLVCQVNTKDEKDWQNFILLGLDETIVLQTQLRHGQISFEDKDVVVKKENLRFPRDQITKLDQDYKETPSADLFIASDSKGNLRCIVRVGTSLKMFTSINSFCNQVAGAKVNLI